MVHEINIKGEGQFSPLGMHCLFEYFTFRANNDRATQTPRGRAVDAHKNNLIHNRICSGENNLLSAIGGARLYEVDDEIGPQPGKLAAGFGEPYVIAGVEAYSTYTVNVEDNEVGARSVGLVGSPWKHLSIACDEFARWAKHDRSVVKVSVWSLFVEGTRNEPDLVTFGNVGQTLHEFALQWYRVQIGRSLSPRLRNYLGVKEVELRVDEHLGRRVTIHHSRDIVRK